MTEEMRSRLLGMILASVSRGVFPQREPIGYLYGHVAKEGETPTHTINGVDYVGVVLPKLPEYDEEAYQYEVIARPMPLNKNYLLLISPSVSYYFTDEGQGGYKLAGDTLYYTYPAKMGYDAETETIYFYPEDGAEWRFNSIVEDGSSFLNSGAIDVTVWGNFDVLNEDGEVRRAGTDPIPIYE